MPGNQFQRMIFAFAYTLKLIMGNPLSFACFSQLFFIQLFVRTIFKILFKKDIEKHVQNAHESEKRVKS